MPRSEVIRAIVLDGGPCCEVWHLALQLHRCLGGLGPDELALCWPALVEQLVERVLPVGPCRRNAVSALAGRAHKETAVKMKAFLRSENEAFLRTGLAEDELAGRVREHRAVGRDALAVGLHVHLRGRSRCPSAMVKDRPLTSAHRSWQAAAAVCVCVRWVGFEGGHLLDMGRESG